MVQCQPTQKCRLAAYLAALTVFLLPAPAFADGSLWAAGHLANLTTFGKGDLLGPGAEIGGTLGVSEYFSLAADIFGSHHFGDVDSSEVIPPDNVAGFSFGLRYDFDVFAYVPYAGISATGYLDTPRIQGGSVETNAGAKFYLGVDWRFRRHWSVGFRGELHTLLTNLSTFPVYTLVGVSAAYHFRL